MRGIVNILCTNIITSLALCILIQRAEKELSYINGKSKITNVLGSTSRPTPST